MPGGLTLSLAFAHFSFFGNDSLGVNRPRSSAERSLCTAEEHGRRRVRTSFIKTTVHSSEVRRWRSFLYRIVFEKFGSAASAGWRGRRERGRCQARRHERISAILAYKRASFTTKVREAQACLNLRSKSRSQLPQDTLSICVIEEFQ
jgi:hypothetical protein